MEGMHWYCLCEAIATFPLADPGLDKEYIKVLYSRARLCALITSKELVCGSLEKPEDLAKMQLKELDVSASLPKPAAPTGSHLAMETKT